MSQRDISDYIIECTKQNIYCFEEICAAAKKEIEEIKLQLHEADKIRIRLAKLNAVLAHFGDNSIKYTRKLQPIAPPSIEMDEELSELVKNICNLLEDGEPRTNRDIIQAIGKYQEDQKVFRALKYLGERGIIKRDESSENRIIHGDNWAKKDVE